MTNNGISVIMPTYNQASFIAMAINSLLNQTHKQWELIIVNDGSRDDTVEVVGLFTKDNRISCYHSSENLGLGKCLNVGISKAKYNYIAYLPSDDLFFSGHLATLLDTLEKDPAAILDFSGITIINYNIMGSSETYYKRNIREGELQLVQVMHKKNDFSWMERDECTTDDYSQMYWDKISLLGAFIPTNQITCQWIDHPNQRHKKISTNYGGGLNVYRSFYNVKTPLRFKPKNSGLIEEVNMYRHFKKVNLKSNNHLKILIVGELSFNPERIYALEEAGHELFGLWAENCWWFHTVGPLPFGNVTEVSKENWKNEIERIRPDIIYGLLSSLVVPLVTQVVNNFPDIPFVWHFKEGPFYGRQNGLWNSIQLLFKRSDGIIFINEDIRQFYNYCFPLSRNTDYMILDGELPKIDWFKDKRKPLLSESIGGFHTVVPGRPFGLTHNHINTLAESNVHFHFYGESWHHMYQTFVKSSSTVAPNHIHLHPACDQENWTEEFFQYDAGWLHFFESKNQGDYLRTNWEDLNIPARMTTLAVAGLPMLQRDNPGHIVATQTICKEMDIGIFFNDMGDLVRILSDKHFMQHIRTNVWNHRLEFSFDFHVPVLIKFFREVIAKKIKKKKVSTKVSVFC